MNDLHSQPPHVTGTTLEALLYGGPLDGSSLPVPEHSSSLTLAEPPLEGHAYFYNIFATVRFHRPTFIHQSLNWDIFAP